MRQILLDNFTLQGSYSFLHGRRSALREGCLQVLLESVVLYDRIYVPNDVLKLNEASQWIAGQFPDVISGRSMSAPDIHHNQVDLKRLGRYSDLLKAHNPFQDFEINGGGHRPEAYGIEWVGSQSLGRSPGYIPEADRYYSFSERHLYYSWFSTKLAGELSLNYVPNPTRVALFLDEDFRAQADIPDFARDILRIIEKVRAEQAKAIQEVFQSAKIPLSLPVVYSYIKAHAKDSDGFVENTRELRDSRDARAYRKYCERLETSYQKGQRDLIDKAREDIESLAAQWSRSLGKSRVKGQWKIGILIPLISLEAPPVETSFPNPFSLDRKPQFVFLHRVLAGR